MDVREGRVMGKRCTEGRVSEKSGGNNSSCSKPSEWIPKSSDKWSRRPVDFHSFDEPSSVEACGVVFAADVNYRDVAGIGALKLTRNRAWLVTKQVVSQRKRR